MIKETEKLSALPYVIAGVSFIPGMGVVFGVIAITWGLVTKKLGGRKLAVIGVCGIGFNVIIYSALFYFGFVQKGGLYDDLRAQLAKTSLISLVQSIEFYKGQNGQYPESLAVLRESLPENSMILMFDPTQVELAAKPRYFHYELSGESHYYLLGLGPDKIAYTDDDLLPEVEIKKSSRIGLLIHENSKKLTRQSL